MSRPERQQNVLDLLEGLRGLEPLKKLFWSELNYQRVNQPLSRRGWAEAATKALTEDPVLFAGGGDDNAFHVIYCRLAADGLLRRLERPVASQLLREHPYALFVFSNRGQTDWHFLNVKFDDQADRRRVFRRITVRPGAGLRTATERIQLLDLTEIHPELFGITPLTIQQRCDAAFDVEAVTKDFFREVANWYFWALRHASFPKDAPKENDGHDHISIIRLITRLIFCWFVKEKELIPGELFDQKLLMEKLAGFAPDKSSAKDSVFYKAILQNLFFATLNTEMDKRGWRREDQNFMAHSLYRYRELFHKPAEALDVFQNIPFLNGGLFECLDKDHGEDAKPRYERIDGFSDRPDSQPVVPDFLFFGGEREVDLSDDYGDKKFKRVPVRGLIHTFNRYNFTVEEDTPIDQEVALDPELSGKVFENLLAAYNPETGATARKQTGSFYTPREIVNYMVDEALIAWLNTKLETAQPSAKDVQSHLRHLFAYNDEPHQFAQAEVDALIATIDNLKSLDPAVGSGAFPIGILHKLVFILGKLDPRNEKWKERQIVRVRDTMATAEKIEDAAARERALRELESQITSINEAFEHNELDYGRKLYLIENCIYGVDIQPIAVQIAKMRFFISLIVDQKIDNAQPNRGVRPLPNLETKFVAANTLIGVNRPGQQLLRNREIEASEAELRRVRERHFMARTLASKAKCREQDEKLRAQIAELLKNDGWDSATARKLSDWNPYDQNRFADFFDPEWMFGLIGGFDMCIGNPPYGMLNKRQNKAEAIVVTEEQLAYYKNHPAYIPAQGGVLNAFRLFILRSVHLLCERGIFSEIFPLAFVGDCSASDLRRWVLENCRVLCIEAFPERDNPAKRVFEAAKMSVCILILERKKCPGHAFYLRMHKDRYIDESNSKTVLTSDRIRLLDKANASIPLLSGRDLDLITKIYSRSLRIADIGHCYTGEIDLTLGKPYISTNPEDAPLLRGAIIDRYTIRREMRQGEFLYLKANKYLSEVGGKKASHFRCERLALQGITGVNEKVRLKMTIIPPQVFCANSVNYIVFTNGNADIHFILGVLNSQVLNYVFSKFSTNSNVNGYEVDNLPIPQNPDVKCSAQICALVEQTLKAKRKNPAADTTGLEQEIDQQVCALYGLTPEEIKIVENTTA